MKHQPTTTQSTLAIINIRGRQPSNPRSGVTNTGAGTGGREPTGVPTVAVVNLRSRKAL